MYKMYDMHGGHLSVKPIADRLKLDIVDMMLGNNYRFNLDNFEKKWKAKQAKTIFGFQLCIISISIKGN